jgi:hypothetical protein
MASCAESKSTLETEYSGRNDLILKKVCKNPWESCFDAQEK